MFQKIQKSKYDPIIDVIKLIENIKEIDNEEETKKRSNSFNCANILDNKNQTKNSIIIEKKNPKDNENQNQIQLIYHLNNANYKTNLHKNSFSSKSLKSEKINKSLNENKNTLKLKLNNKYSIGKISDNSLESFPNKTKLKNFVLKSEILKLDKKKKLNNKDNIDIYKLLTKRTKDQEKLEKYQFYLFANDNNNNDCNKKNIISNIYMDNEEENEELKEEFNINLINFFGNNNNELNYNYQENNDPNKELYSMKSIYDNNLNINNIKSQINNINNKNINSNKNANNENKINYNNNNISQNTSQNNIIFNTFVNNYINNSYIFENKSNNDINYTNNYYSNSQSPLYCKSNYNMLSYNNNYNSNNSGTNNFQNIDNFGNPYIFNKYNINIFNNINYNDNYSLAKNANYLLKTQFGCKILQEKSQSDHKFTNELLFPEIKNNLKELCCDFICNYFIKNILDILSLSNIDLFLFSIKDSLYDISLTEPGSRIIQKLIEKIYNYPLILNKFTFYLTNKNIGILFNSPYGNHVLQKYITLVKNKEYTNYIYNYILNHFLEIAREKYGICVIQKGLSEGDDEQRRKILEYILMNLDIIIKDNYGNFILQYIFTKFEKKNYFEILPIIRKIEENIVEYCKCKNPASIIEKCFERGDPKISCHLIKYLIDNHSNSLKEIIYNPYGFYVIKKSILIQNKEIKEYIMRAIIENIDKIKEINNGKKIIEAFSNEYKEFSYLLNLKIKNQEIEKNIK